MYVQAGTGASIHRRQAPSREPSHCFGLKLSEKDRSHLVKLSKARCNDRLCTGTPRPLSLLVRVTHGRSHGCAARTALCATAHLFVDDGTADAVNDNTVTVTAIKAK